MRRRTATLTAVALLAAAMLGLSGCGNSKTPPAASIDNGGGQTTGDPGTPSALPPTAGQSASPINTPAPDLSNTAPPPAASRYTQSATAAPSAPTGNRYPSFVKAKAIDVKLSTSRGVVRLRLFPDKAPATVDNFIRNYVETSFYEGSIVHYADQSMVVAGGFRKDFSDLPATLPVRCEAKNGLKNVRGTIAMGRLPQEIDSATSHFFFNVQDNPDFDHQGETAEDYGYCVFGEVVEGMAIVDEISRSPTKESNGLANVPAEPVVVEKVEVIR